MRVFLLLYLGSLPHHCVPSVSSNWIPPSSPLRQIWLRACEIHLDPSVMFGLRLTRGRSWRPVCNRRALSECWAELTSLQTAHLYADPCRDARRNEALTSCSHAHKVAESAAAEPRYYTIPLCRKHVPKRIHPHKQEDSHATAERQPCVAAHIMVIRWT